MAKELLGAPRVIEFSAACRGELRGPFQPSPHLLQALPHISCLSCSPCPSQHLIEMLLLFGGGIDSHDIVYKATVGRWGGLHWVKVYALRGCLASRLGQQAPRNTLTLGWS